MDDHLIIDFVSPGLASCSRCHQLLDVYEWSEPCEASVNALERADQSAPQPQLVAD